MGLVELLLQLVQLFWVEGGAVASELGRLSVHAVVVILLVVSLNVCCRMRTRSTVELGLDREWLLVLISIVMIVHHLLQCCQTNDSRPSFIAHSPINRLPSGEPGVSCDPPEPGDRAWLEVDPGGVMPCMLAAAFGAHMCVGGHPKPPYGCGGG